MMNKRIRSMVDEIFSEMKMTAENLALRDELMANAQARYEDAVAQGKSEEEAFVEVAASLEDVCGLLEEMKRMDEQQSGITAMIENLQRQDLDYIEEAMGICAMMRQCHMGQEQAARLLGKSQSAVANKLRLLRHSDKVLDALREAELTERHARALLRLPEEAQKLDAIAEIRRQGMSVARAERYIDSLLATARPRKEQANVGAFLTSLSQSLDRIQRSGIPAISERRETDSQIVLTITIPKNREGEKSP